MTKVIAFSLWGNNPKYTIGAVRNAEIAKEVYSDWVCRYYISEDVDKDIIKKLEDLGSEIISMGATGWNGMFWRFFAADREDTMISRDTDSRLCHREKAAVDAWLASDKDFHIMRDHPYHATEILGGMWGVRNGLLKGIADMIEVYDKGEFDNKYQVDQNFLREVIYEKVLNTSIVHDEFFEMSEWPSNAPPRTNTYFVGQVYDHMDRPEFS